MPKTKYKSPIHTCQIGEIKDGASCQFEGKYNDVIKEIYSDFFKNYFTDENNLVFCPFHAPIKLKKTRFDEELFSYDLSQKLVEVTKHIILKGGIGEVDLSLISLESFTLEDIDTQLSIKIEDSEFNYLDIKAVKAEAIYLDGLKIFKKASLLDIILESVLMINRLCSPNFDSEISIQRLKVSTILFSSQSYISEGSSYINSKITFTECQFGNTYSSYMGSVFECQNKIFRNEFSIQESTFFRPPNFLGSSFGWTFYFRVKFKKSAFFGVGDYSFYRYLRNEMSRKNLYKEASLFHLCEEKAMQFSDVISRNKTKESKKLDLTTRSYLAKTLSILLKIICIPKTSDTIQSSFNKENKENEDWEFDLNPVQMERTERILSFLHEVTSNYGTSFGRIISFYLILTLAILPTLYYADCCFLSLHCNNALYGFEESINSTLKPFSYGDDILSSKTAIKVIQMLAQATLYAVFFFMVRRRFRISS